MSASVDTSTSIPGLAQEVLSALLDKYMNEGIQDIENLGNPVQ